MIKDFYDHMEKEQEVLNLSYKESLRQKEERMGSCKNCGHGCHCSDSSSCSSCGCASCEHSGE